MVIFQMCALSKNELHFTSCDFSLDLYVWYMGVYTLVCAHAEARV